MFGVSHALSFTGNFPASRAVGQSGAALNPATAFQAGMLRPGQKLFSQIQPLKQQDFTQRAQQPSLTTAGAVSGLREIGGGKDLRALANLQTLIAPENDGFIAESNFIFFADIRTEGPENMAEQDPSQQPITPLRGEASMPLRLEADTAENNTRVMISIGDGLQGRSLSAIGQALSHHLSGVSAGFSNLRIAVTQHLSPSVVVAEISASMDVADAQDKNAEAVSHEQPVRATLAAAVNSLQQCQGVVSIEADHHVKQL